MRNRHKVNVKEGSSTAENAAYTALPADLPEDWVVGQAVAPDGGGLEALLLAGIKISKVISGKKEGSCGER